MKKLLAISVLAASAGAQALPLNAGFDAVLTGSGATAQDPALFESVTGARGVDTDPLCTGNITVYTEGALVGSPSSSSWAVACTTDLIGDVDGDGVAGEVLIRKHDGGSATSPQGVCGSLADVDWSVIGVSSTCSASGVGPVGSDAEGLTVNTGCSLPDTTTSDFGLSDLEQGRLLEFNTICADNGVALDVDVSTNGVIFGVAATDSLYVALQNAQGLDSDVNSDGIPDAQNTYAEMAGFEAAFEANMPSLTRAQIAGIPQNLVQDWDVLGVSEPAGINNQTKWCTRNTSSGTRASLEAKITQSTCAGNIGTLVDNTPGSAESSGSPWTNIAPAVVPPVPFPQPSCTSTGDTCIVNVDGSGRMDQCLVAWNANTAGTEGTFAMGFQASDRDMDSGSRQGWEYIKVDGLAPTIANSITGAYPFTVEANLIAAGLSAEQLALVQDLATSVTNPTFLDNRDQKFGPAGFYATTDAGDCTAGGVIACGGYGLSGVTNSCNFLIQDQLP